MILEKEKNHATQPSHTHTQHERKASDSSLFSPHLSGGRYFVKQTQIFMDSGRYTKSRVVSVQMLAGQWSESRSISVTDLLFGLFVIFPENGLSKPFL